MQKKLSKIKNRIKRFFSLQPHLKFFYAYYFKHARIDEQAVLIESFHGNVIGDSGLVFAQEIERLYPGRYKVYFATQKYAEHRKFINDQKLKAEPIDINSVRYTKLLATVRYIFTNASLPIYFVKRPEQTYLQTWHGTPLKTLGKKMREGIESMYNVQHNFLQADYITHPNEFTRDVIMEDYNLNSLYTGKVVMAGYPRNRIFFDPDSAASTREKYGLTDKTVYAYMPTWRGKSNQDINTTTYIRQVMGYFRQIDKSLRDDQLLYVNMHPIVKADFVFDGFKRIRPFPDDTDTYTFLASTDALITDYSSAFFDYSLTKKPIILFMYDYEEYLKERGLYLDIKTLPFRQLFTIGELLDCLRSDAALADRYEDTDYFREYFAYDSPDNAAKLLDLVFNGNEGDLKIIDYSQNTEKRRTVYRPACFRNRFDLETVARAIGERGDRDKAIVWLYRAWIKKRLSPVLHDLYNDSFDYIITTNTPPRTHLEEIAARLGSGKAKQRIHERDLMRSLPNLDLEPEIISEYPVFEEKCRVPDARVDTIEGRVEAFEDSRALVRFKTPEAVEVRNAAILLLGNIILESRPLTEQEKKEELVSFDLRPSVESFELFRNDYAQVGLVGVNASGTTVLYKFRDADLLQKGQSAGIKEHRLAYYYEPHIWNAYLPEDYHRVNYKRILYSTDPDADRRMSAEEAGSVATEINTHFFVNSRGEISLRVKRAENTLARICPAYTYRSVHCSDNAFVVRAYASGWKPDTIRGAYLEFRSKVEEIRIPLKCTVEGHANGCLITLYGDLRNDRSLKSVYWDIRIETEYCGRLYPVTVGRLGFFAKARLASMNIQTTVNEKDILFPYCTRANTLAFTFREKTPYDTAAFRRREGVATVLYLLGRPFLKMKKIWIVFEKFSQTAQDNSYYFFRYCMEELPQHERKRIYYVIDKKSADHQKIAKYGRNVIDYMSLRHMIYAMAMKICISTDSMAHLYLWRPKPSYVFEQIKKKPEFFLQHGVTAMKQVHKLFGKNGSSPMAYFVATSQLEQDIIVKNFRYARKNVPITGFARWDVLEDKQKEDDRFVLVMPTWRSWLEEVREEEFLMSEYYQNYISLLTDPALTDLLEKENFRLELFMHPKFASYIEGFRDKISGRVSCEGFGKEPLNEVMMRCSMLITDYSSVCWDVLYMEKPVIFYQFDREQYLDVHGSYIDFETDLPGTLANSNPEVIDALRSYAASGFRIHEADLEKSRHYFEYKDQDNSKRTAEFLLERGY